MKQNAIQPANLEFNAEGTPVSRDFDDVYFSNDNGLEETRYVFLAETSLMNVSLIIHALYLSLPKAGLVPALIS